MSAAKVEAGAPVSGGRLLSPLFGGLGRRVARAQSDLRKSDLTIGYEHIDIGFTEGAFLTSSALVLMTWVCVRFRLNSGFLIVFALGAVLIAAGWMGYFNIRRLRLRAGSIEPVFAGEDARISIRASSPGHPVQALELICGDHGRIVDLQPGDDWRADLSVATRSRGWQLGPQIAVQTAYPFSLWRAFAVWVPVNRFLVYPAIDKSVLELPRTLLSKEHDNLEEGLAPVSSLAGDSFSHLRPYRRGDSLRSVAWRSAARTDHDGQGLLSKQMDGVDTARSQRVHLSLTQMLSESAIDLESAISRLCAYILIAERMGLDYSVEAGRRVINPPAPATRKSTRERAESQGDSSHLHRCLMVVAILPSIPGDGK